MGKILKFLTPIRSCLRCDLGLAIVTVLSARRYIDADIAGLITTLLFTI